MFVCLSLSLVFYLNVQQVELDGISAVNVLIREEELLLQHNDFVLLNTLLTEGLVRVQPNGYEETKTEAEKEMRRAPLCSFFFFVVVGWDGRVTFSGLCL